MATRSIPVAKLLLEAFAIFLGVTAGFLAENYRQHLNDREQEREALAQIIRDLEIDEADIRPIVDRSTRISEAMIWLHNNIRRESVPPDSVVQVLGSVPAVHSYEAARGATDWA